MNSRNLIPIQRQTINRRRRAVRRWIFINCIYLVILGVIGTACAMTPLNRDGPAQPSSMAIQDGELPADVPALTQEVAVLRKHLGSLREVTDRPDWSILLAALSETLGDDVVLNAVDCTQDASGADRTGTTSGTLPEMFRITGIGQSQNSVTRFVLGIENLQIFTQVRLLQTEPQALRGQNCVGFEIICTIPQHMKVAK